MGFRERPVAGGEPRFQAKQPLLARSAFVICAALVLLGQSIVLAIVQDETQLRLNLVLQTVTLVLLTVWSLKIAGTYLSPPLVFTACIYMWHSTFSLGYYFHLAPVFEYSGRTFTYGFEYVFKATSLVGLSISLTVLGVLSAYTRQRSRYLRAEGSSLLRAGVYSSVGRLSNWVAWIGAAIMLLILFLFLLREGAVLLRGEYIDVYYNASRSLTYLLFERTKFFWAVIIVLLIASNRRNYRKLTILAIMAVVLALITAMLGTRSEPFIILSAFIISLDCFVKPLRLWMIVVLLAAFSAASYVIDNDRDTGLGFHVFKFSDSGKQNIDLWYLFYQNGQDIRAILRTMAFSQESHPKYGESFLDAALSVVPAPILKQIGYEQPIQPSVWLATSSPDVGYYNGIGYSLVAEMYYNFRMYGCLGFFLIGWFLSSSYFRYVLYKDIFSCLSALVVAVIFTLHMRSDSGVYMRVLLYSFAVVALLRHERTAVVAKALLNRNRSRSMQLTFRDASEHTEL